MRIITLPKNFYKAYDYALKYNIFHEFRERYEKPIRESYTTPNNKMPISDYMEVNLVLRSCF